MRESRGGRQKSKLEQERLLYVEELGFLSLVVKGTTSPANLTMA